MSRRAVLKVVKAKYTPGAPWMVRVPPRLQLLEGARKKFFAKESVAKAYVERLAKELGDYHRQALGLSDRQITPEHARVVKMRVAQPPRRRRLPAVRIPGSSERPKRRR